MQSSGMRQVINYGMTASGKFRLEGAGLTFDASMKANIGFILRQIVELNTTSFYAECLSAINVRRTIAFSGGDGIVVRGGFKYVELISPVVSNVSMAPGAGVFAVAGVGGLRVTRGLSSEGGYPKRVRIVNPQISNIYSEDATYHNDMDAIAVFGDSAEGGAGFSTFSIEGGQITDCWGRDVKCQMSTGEVSGLKIHKSQGPTSKITQPSIDFQVGPGIIRDVDWTIDGVYIDSSLVNQSTPTVGTFKTGNFENSSINIVNGGGLLTALGSYPRQLLFGLLRAKGIAVNGPLDHFCRIYTPDASTVVVLEQITCSSLVGEFARVSASGVPGSSAPYSAKVALKYCVNHGPVVPLVRANIAGSIARAHVEDEGCVGFSGQITRRSNTNTVQAGAQSIRFLTGDYETGGGVVMRAAVVGADDSYEFPVAGFASLSIAMVSMGARTDDQGIVLIGSACSALSIGSGMAVGSSAEPEEGRIRVWRGPGGGLMVKNADASSRVITVMFFG